MTPLFKYVSPIIGTKGVYTVTEPFVLTNAEVLECIAVRTLADYVANNEDPQSTIYLANGLTEQNYLDDLAVNMEIVSLRNDGGYIYHIPCKYISSYPIQDGVNYQAVAIICKLPAMRASQSYDTVNADLTRTILSNLGVDSAISVVATTHLQAVDGARDQEIQVSRALIIDENITMYAQLAEKDRQIANLQQQVQVLQQYIIDNNP